VKGRIDVGGTLKSSEYLEFGDINVGGTVKLENGGSGQLIDVGGTFSSEGALRFTRIDVGGTVKLEGGAEGEDLSVGGTLKSGGDFTLSNRLKVGGSVSVDGVLRIASVRVGGKIEADKIYAEQFIETSSISTRYGAKATRIEIERKGIVRGPLVGEIITLKDRAEAEDVYADRIQLRGGCRAGNLYGRVIRIDSRCDVESVTYTEELRADDSVRIRNGSQKSEKLPEPPI
jgi:cytoskeletal protein CcmA (bactofilin family)